MHLPLAVIDRVELVLCNVRAGDLALLEVHQCGAIIGTQQRSRYEDRPGRRRGGQDGRV